MVFKLKVILFAILLFSLTLLTGDNITMANEALNTVFLLNQQVDLTYQETDQTPRIREAYE
ncbi:hypothetical protein KAR10_07730, partial [bacterium]|nr:hypothetical protein [bacterium]